MASTNALEQDLLRLVRTQASDQRLASVSPVLPSGIVAAPLADSPVDSVAGGGDAIGE